MSSISINGLLEEQWVADVLNKLGVFSGFVRTVVCEKPDIQNQHIAISVKKENFLIMVIFINNGRILL